MNQQLRKLILYITGAFLFNILFYREQMALNTVFFDVFLLSALFYLYPSARANMIVRWLLVANVICLGTLLLHNTVLTKYAFICTLLLIAGFSEYMHRSAWYAGGSVFLNFFLFIGNLAETVSGAFGKKTKRKSSWTKYVKFSIIPVAIAFVFFIIYAGANSVFANIVGNAANWLELNFERLFFMFKPERIFFTLFGFYIIGSLLAKTRINYFSVNDIAHSDELIRRRKTLRRKFMIQPMPVKYFSTVGLKNENLTGVISLVLLNVLLFFVNCIDINYVWMHFEFSPDKPLYKLVHEGTGLLIVSIILAMAVVLFFFKGNLNFYKRNKWLKYGTYLWICQNAFLVLSVLLRDYYYIQHYGLAYKRIGVLFFLLMVLMGLATVFIKVYTKKTSYFLFRVNAWAAVFLLVAASCVNWDVLMVRYNLAHRNEITFLDTAFLLGLSDRTLPVLHENESVFTARDPALATFINERTEGYLKTQEQYSWLSWNYADSKVKNYFSNANKTASK
jgi:hypothetical protein